MPTVSIIIPAHNAEATLQETIDSVLAQTYPDYELIIVDDGSTDGTAALIDAVKDERVRYLYQANAERSAARNNGISQSLGEYITFLDADDLFLPNKLAVQVAALDADKELGLVAGGNHYIDAHGNIIGSARGWEWATPLDLDIWLRHSPCWLPHIMVRRAWVDRIEGFDTAISHGEDYDWLLRLAVAGCPMAWVHEVVYAYRLHAGQTVVQAQKMIDGHFYALDKLFALEGLPPEIVAQRDEILDSHRLTAAMRALDGGLSDIGRNYLAAIATISKPKLAETFGRNAIHPMWQSDPRDMIDRAFNDPSTRAIALAFAEREQFFLAAKQGRKADLGSHFFGVLRRRARLIDRGMLSIFMRQGLRNAHR